MIHFFFGDKQVTMQIIPIYGFSARVLYYDPKIDPNIEEVDEEDFFQQITIMFLIFGIHITII